MKRSWFLLTLSALFCCTLLSFASAADVEEGFVSMFDGKTLDGWDGNPDLWSVRDGVITGQTTKEKPTKGNTFLIYRKAEPGNFEIRIKYRMVGGNSGLQFRSVEVAKWVISGYQGDFDASGHYTGILYEEKGRGIIGRRGFKTIIGADGKKTTDGETTPDKVILESVNKEDWNDFTVIAKGNHIIEKLNGNVTIELIDNQVDKRRMKGLIALQLHAGPPMLIQFKDIRIKMLDEKPKATPAPAEKKR
jgi:hypothetical protein